MFQMIIFVMTVGVNDIWEDKNDREQTLLIVDPYMVVIVIRAMMMLQVMTGGMVNGHCQDGYSLEDDVAIHCR